MRLNQDGMPGACSTKRASLRNEVVSLEAIAEEVATLIEKSCKEKNTPARQLCY